jgi:hypothetical protein
LVQTNPGGGFSTVKNECVAPHSWQVTIVSLAE